MNSKVVAFSVLLVKDENFESISYSFLRNFYNKSK